MLDFKKIVTFFQQWDYIFFINQVVYTSLKLCPVVRQIIVIPTF